MQVKLALVLLLQFSVFASSAQTAPLRAGVVGLTHTHVHGILGRENKGDIVIVGIVEPNRQLALRYAAEHHFSMDLVYATMDEMIAKTKPEAVTAFGTIYEHLAVVEKCAPLGIHVMVEKPLAVSLAHAKRIAEFARKHKIHLLTNYETTWYPTTQLAYDLVQRGEVGDIRKVVVRDGHRGPKKIGVNEEFLTWLTDPVQNGGGAITDFGCYGANLLTWLHKGQRPKTITAVTSQWQPENNPKVEDEATIVLTYEKSQAIIEASWNWPIGRKDMEIYGLTGAIYADNRNQLRVRYAKGYDGFEEKLFMPDALPSPRHDPFALLAAVVRGQLTLERYNLSSLENNLIVMEILDAAIKSAKLGKTVVLR
jgi:predicted dehydrogenase